MRWGRCGARGRASQARTREALGRRPSPLRGTAFNGWTRHGRRAAKAARIGEGAALPSAPGSYGPGDRNRRHGAPSGERACAGRADATNADKWRKLRTLVCAASGLMIAPPSAPFPSHACRVYPICADKKCGGLRKAPLSGDGKTAYPAPPRIRAIAHVHSIRSSPRKQGPSSGCPLARA